MPGSPASRWTLCMPPFSFTLRHNATTFHWELADSGDATACSHHATHSSAFHTLASDPQIAARGATVRVFGADGGYERERTYAPAEIDAVSAPAPTKLAL